MLITLIHISDIHLKTDESNPILLKVDALSAAIKSNLTVPSHCILLVSGDVAHSGAEDQYKLAEELLDKLALSLFEEKNVLSWDEVFVPGNHDCELTSNPVSRELLLDSILVESAVSSKINDNKIEECLHVQDNFFAFVARRTSKTFPNVSDRLAWKHLVTVDKQTVAIRCFNTAWLSRMKEKKNALLAPVWLADTNFQSDFDVVMFHHPFAWLDTTNGRQFAKLVEQSSDLISTGHEHDPNEYIKHKITGEVNTFFEANALQDENDLELSGFRIYSVDLEQRVKKTTSYTWKNDIYDRTTASEWTAFERSKSVVNNRFQNTEEFSRWLKDAGAGFLHPRKEKLQLRDIYVYPDASEWDIARGKVKKKVTARINCENLAGYVRDNQKVIIYGSERAGKTTLTKVLYTDLMDQDVVPLRLLGEQLTKSDQRFIEKAIEKQFTVQYGDHLMEYYRQLPPERKVIIVDNFQKTTLNREGWSQLIDRLLSACGSLVLVANDSFQIQELRDANLREHPLLAFKHCQIKEFGQMRRYEMINKWMMLGQEHTLADADKTMAVKQVEQVMRVVLGRNLLPSYPIFILTILQSHEAASTKDTVTGAFSYHFEFLIKQQLGRVATKMTPDTLVTYLSAIAFRMFSEKRRCLDQSQLDTVTNDYKVLHTMSFDNENEIDALLNAQVLEILPDNRYRFGYSYIYYYFVAKYFATNLHSRQHEQTLRVAIAYIVNYIHVETYANIIIFLFYLTPDEELIQLMISKAKEQYTSFQPCDYDSDFDFTKILASLSPPEVTLNGATNPDTGLEYRRRVDEANENDEVPIEDDDSIKEQELDDYLRINLALKVMQILGQMVRNVPGSLTGATKREIIREAYLVGLRLMNYVSSLMRDDVEAVRNHYASMIQKELRIDNPKELMVKTNTVLNDLILMAAHGIIQRISYAVGSVHLSQTYELIDDPLLKVPISLIDIAIKLDHFDTFPTRKVFESHKKLENNYISQTVVRTLVRDYFYKYPEDYTLRQSVCNRLGIKVNESGFLERANKKLLPNPHD